MNEMAENPPPRAMLGLDRSDAEGSMRELCEAYTGSTIAERRALELQFATVEWNAFSALYVDLFPKLGAVASAPSPSPACRGRSSG